MEARGLEPLTSRTSSERSSQLSYASICDNIYKITDYRPIVKDKLLATADEVIPPPTVLKYYRIR